MHSSSTRSQRRLLCLFVVVSLALHVLLVAVFVVPPYLRKMHDAQAAADARKQADHRAEQRRQETARAAEEQKRIAATQAAEEARQLVTAELRDEFKAVLGEKVQPADADEMWSEILAQLTAGLDGYSQEMADPNAQDAGLRQELTELQARMLAELAARLRERSKRELADAFVARVKNDVAPKLIDFNRRQLETRIGNALRDAGAKIVQEDVADIRARRTAVVQALADAERQARSAVTDLAGAKRRLEAATKLADAQRKAGKEDAADKKLSDAVRAEQAGVDRAARSIGASGQSLRDAAGKSDVLSGETIRAIRAAGPEVDAAAKETARAKSAVQHGNAPEVAASTGDAAALAGKLADAIHAAKAAAYNERGDLTLEARAALKRARDEDLKNLIEQSFWQRYVNRSAPRVSDKLTGVFRQTLEQGGIKDEATVADVSKRVKAALIDGVRDKIKAGQAGTDPLSKGQHLDDVADDNPAGPHGPAATGPAEHRGHGDHGDGAVAAIGAATHPANADNGHRAASARQEAIAERIGKTARELVHTNIDGAGDDDAADAAAVDAVHGNAAAKRGKGNADDGDAGGLAGLAARVGRLAGNVRSGRTDLAEAAQAAGGFGAGAFAGAGFGAAGWAGIPHASEFDHYHGPLLRHRARYVNEAEYKAITAGIHERDLLAARGQAATRRGAEADVAGADVGAAGENPFVSRPAIVLVPAPAADPIGQPARSEPFKPGFKSIRFAAIPYRAKPVVIDGDLSEWKDVPELSMTPALYGHALKPELKKFPQAVKAQWDNTGFYLAYDVKDADDKITRANPGNFWEADGVEFWVDTLNTKEKGRTQCTHQFWAWVEPSVKDPSKVGGEARSWPGEDEYIGLGSDVIKTASKRTPGGWTIEVFVPASRFRMLDLQPGRILGMNFSICTGTDLYYYWAGTTEVATARRPDTWGDALLAGSAGRLECVDKLASELKPGESAKTLSAQRIGQPLRIRVTDPDMNLSNSSRDHVAVTVTTRRGARQTVVLEETGDATGIFEAALRTSLDAGDAPAANNLPLLDGDSIDITYIDQCRPDGARDVPVKLSLPTAAAITSLPKQ